MKEGRARYDGRQGFALIVVLFSLVVLTTLFAIATDRTMATIQRTSAEALLAERPASTADLLRLAGAWRLDPAHEGETGFDLVWQGEEVRVGLVDVSGLIDLNAAAPALLESVADYIGASPSQLATYRAWRREGNRLLRVEDFPRVMGIDPLEGLEEVATVFSGRSEVSLNAAPEAVRALVGKAMAGQTPHSETTYAVFVRTGEGGSRRQVGVVAVASGADIFGF